MNSAHVNLPRPHRPVCLLCVVAAFVALPGMLPAQITTRYDAAAKLLNEWFAAGTAAGLGAVTYENRDSQHSPLNTTLYPQLKVFQHDASTGSPTGPATRVRSAPTVGNCSMSAPAANGGCLPRFYALDPRGQLFLAQQYLANNLFIYPEHQDHDIGANGVGGYGDLLPLNTPTLIISQGSSLSDQPFVQAVLSTIAALPPETQELLIKKRLLMPVVQAIFRQSNKMVKEDKDYFLGSAHPPVFDAAMLDEEKMVRMAHEMTPARVPPVALVAVEEEMELAVGRDYFEPPNPRSFKLADTPVNIARLMRGNRAEHVLLVNAGRSADILGRPVQLRWQLLQGDPRLVRVESSGAGPYARVRVRWHPPMITSTGIRSHRVDIGIFATNGISVSAPAILSFYMLPNEMRFHDEKGRVTEICYQTHNPDFGLPRGPRDERWLKVLLALTVRGDGLRSRLIDPILSRQVRAGLQEIYLALNPRFERVRALETVPEQKEAAAKLRAETENDLAAALDKKLPGGRNLTARGTIESALSAIAGFAELYIAFQKEIDDLAVRSPKPSASPDIRAEVRRLVELGVLIEQASGSYVTTNPPDSLSAAERHHLRGLNLTIMGCALFPEALERSPAPAWVDTRLTLPKPWRDVFRYDEESGALTGWLRHGGGKTAWFDAEGRLLPEGPRAPRHTVPVVYEKGPADLLTWRVK